MIESFRGTFLSNFWPVELVGSDGIVYPTAEHAYQACKTTDRKSRARIAACRTPADAKRMGHTLTVRKDWDKIKLDCMTRILRKKFAPGTPLAEQLIATGEDYLVENNTWGDTFWGVCQGKGQNHLGEILMGLREELLAL